MSEIIKNGEYNDLMFFDPLNWGGITKTFNIFIIAFGVTPIVVSACNGAYVFGGQFKVDG
jgi:hypothetical protein